MRSNENHLFKGALFVSWLDIIGNDNKHYGQGRMGTLRPPLVLASASILNHGAMKLDRGADFTASNHYSCYTAPLMSCPLWPARCCLTTRLPPLETLSCHVTTLTSAVFPTQPTAPYHIFTPPLKIYFQGH